MESDASKPRGLLGQDGRRSLPAGTLPIIEPERISMTKRKDDDEGFDSSVCYRVFECVAFAIMLLYVLAPLWIPVLILMWAGEVLQ